MKTPDTWFIKKTKEGKEHGPYTLKQIKGFVRQGKLNELHWLHRGDQKLVSAKTVIEKLKQRTAPDNSHESVKQSSIDETPQRDIPDSASTNSEIPESNLASAEQAESTGSRKPRLKLVAALVTAVFAISGSLFATGFLGGTEENELTEKANTKAGDTGSSELIQGSGHPPETGRRADAMATHIQQDGVAALAPEGNQNRTPARKPVSEKAEQIRYASNWLKEGKTPEVLWTWKQKAAKRVDIKQQSAEVEKMRNVQSLLGAFANLSATSEQASVFGMYGKYRRLMEFDERRREIEIETGYSNPKAIWGVSEAGLRQFKADLKTINKTETNPVHSVYIHEQGGGIIEVDDPAIFEPPPETPVFDPKKLENQGKGVRGLLGAFGQINRDMSQMKKNFEPGWYLNRLNYDLGVFCISLVKGEEKYEIRYRLNGLPYSLPMEEVVGIEVDGRMIVGHSNTRDTFRKTKSTYTDYVQGILLERIVAIQMIEEVPADAVDVLKTTAKNWAVATLDEINTRGPSSDFDSNDARPERRGNELEPASNNSNLSSGGGRKLHLELKWPNGNEYDNADFKYVYSGWSTKKARTDASGRCSIPWPSGKTRITLWLSTLNGLLGPSTKQHDIKIPSNGRMLFRIPKS